MTTNINDVIVGFSPEDQKDIQAVTQNIIEEYDILVVTPDKSVIEID